MTRPEARVSMPSQPSSKERPPPAEATPSPPDAVASRRILHLALALILTIPALAWLLRSPSAGEGGIVGAEQTGEAAAEFTLDLFDGGTFTLSDHLAQDGRPLVLNFWASWCVPCREEMPAFDAVARRHPEVLVLGVAVQDTEAAARAFAKEVAVSYPVGLDAGGRIVELYPIIGLPTTWFITSEGTISTQWTGRLDQDLLESLIEEHLTR